MDKLSSIVSLVYGILVIAGGVMGFVKAHSKYSLITGLVSGIIVLISCKLNTKGSYLFICAVSLMLAGFFAYRFAHTHAFMPSGLMLTLSAVSFCVVGLGWLKNRN